MFLEEKINVETEMFLKFKFLMIDILKLCLEIIKFEMLYATEG